VSTVSSPPRPDVTVSVDSSWMLRLRTLDGLLPASILLWAVGVWRTDAAHLGPYGLVGALPIVFYVGLGLLVVSAAAELGRQVPSRIRMSLHAVALVVMLYGTAPLVYPEGRYSWLYKTIGVVQYVNAHGQLNSSIDIYQNWPGFFAFAAWFDKVAGVGSPLVYAKWGQLVVELAALPLLHMAYTALSLPVRQRWMAILLYSASNWIGQDYFSPQALGTLLGLGVLAIALRWMFAGNAAGPSRWLRQWEQGRDVGSTYWARWRIRRALPFVLTLILVFSVLVFSHELTPYVVIIQLGCLAVAGLLRPRWVPLVLAGVAIAYLLPRFDYVNRNFGLLSSFGDFFSNATPPSRGGGLPVPASQRLIQYCADALSLVIWATAAAGAWLRRRSRRTVLALLILAYSPIVVLGLGAYGNEGLLRVYLFSLPWAAALVAAALAPLPLLARTTQPRLKSLARRLAIGRRRRPPAHAAEPPKRAPQNRATVIRMLVAMLVSLSLFFPAFFGDDAANTVSVSEVDAITSFMQSAPPGVVFMATEGAPYSDTSRYNLYTATFIFGPGTIVNTNLPGPYVADLIAKTAEGLTGSFSPSYVIVSPAMLRYNASHPVTPQASFRILLASLARSPEWIPLMKSHGIYIYELPAGTRLLEPGPLGPR
jgi:hypothetical protein